MGRVRILTAVAVLAAIAGVALPVAAVPNQRGVHCASAAGVWRARADKPSDGLAETITVKLEQTPDGLVGTASTDYWTGAAGSMPPSGCAPGVVHRVLDAPMAARLDGSQLSWWVTNETAIREHTICGSPTGGPHTGGGSFGHVDLAAGTFEARFQVHTWERPLLYLHVSCS